MLSYSVDWQYCATSGPQSQTATPRARQPMRPCSLIHVLPGSTMPAPCCCAPSPAGSRSGGLAIAAARHQLRQAAKA